MPKQILFFGGNIYVKYLYGENKLWYVKGDLYYKSEYKLFFELFDCDKIIIYNNEFDKEKIIEITGFYCKENNVGKVLNKLYKKLSFEYNDFFEKYFSEKK